MTTHSYEALEIKFKKPKKSAHPVAFVTGASTVDKVGKQTFYVGGADREKLEWLDFLRLLRKMIRDAKAFKLKDLSLRVKDLRSLLESPSIPNEVSDYELGIFVGENLDMANYEFVRYKTSEEDMPHLVRQVFIRDASKEFKKGVARGLTIAHFANLARDWANTPAADMTPEIFTDQARDILEKNDLVTVEVIFNDELVGRGLHMVYNVGKGSENPSRVIVAKYNGAGPDDPWIALVGKGVCYDTGGHSLKPSEGMLEMHLDMSGGAGVLAAFGAIAELGIKKNVVVVVPAVENSISAKAQRPGDISNSFSGKSVEVQNTDAEGRLILGDAIAYAAKVYKPRYMLEAATLTGASLIAVGQFYSALFTKDDELAEQLIRIGELCDEELWRLPLTKRFTAQLKENTRAHMKNIVSHGHKWGGASIGAAFVQDFAPENVSFAHLDIAPRMESIKGDQLADGATGVPVRLLVRAVETL